MALTPSTMLPLAARFLQLQPPAPDTPGPFRLSDGVALETLLRAAGFEDVRVESRPLVLESIERVRDRAPGAAAGTM